MVTIVTRAGKGSPLTNTEVDTNFTNLNSGKVETSAVGTIAAQNASSVSITGGSVTGITDLAVADGGTGVSALTANNVILGNGTSAVQFVAPSTSGNLLTSNGTTWSSATPNPEWITKLKTVTQSFTSNITLANDPYLFITMVAGEKYFFRFNYVCNYGIGGIKFFLSAPGTPTAFTVAVSNLATLSTGANATILSYAPTSGPLNVGFSFYGYIQNGATPGNLVMQLAQHVSNAAASQYLAGSFLEYMKIP